MCQNQALTVLSVPKSAGVGRTCALLRDRKEEVVPPGLAPVKRLRHLPHTAPAPLPRLDATPWGSTLSTRIFAVPGVFFRPEAGLGGSKAVLEKQR